MKNCKNILKNKKAGTKLLSLWWFAVLVVISVAIVLATAIFSSSQADIRLIESQILANKLSSCFLEEGKISQDIISNQADIFQKCNINKEILDKSTNYYLEISFAQLGPSDVKTYSYGNNAFKKECEISQAMINAKYFPKCTEKKVYALDDFGNKITLTIIAGSNNGYRLKQNK